MVYESDIKEPHCRIKDFEDYIITSSGDVYSERPIGGRKSRKLKKLSPKNPGKDNKYLNIILCNDIEQKTFSIHRLVAEYFVDGYFEGAVVNHINGNNRDNNYRNLEWITQTDNIHKSYDSSGTNQVRNYKWHELYDPCGVYLGTFKGGNELKNFIESNNLDASPTGLLRNGISKGYKVVKLLKDALENCNDYPKGVPVV